MPDTLRDSNPSLGVALPLLLLSLCTETVSFSTQIQKAPLLEVLSLLNNAHAWLALSTSYQTIRTSP
jgi:hypothetical protein